MTKEQEVELDKLSTYLDYAKTDNLEEVIVSTKTIETVLNILKEKIAEVEIHTGLEHFYKKDYLDKAELLREANAKLKEKDKEIEKRDNTVKKIIKRLDNDIKRTKEEIKYWEERYRNAKESNKKSFYRKINRCQSRFETLREILNIIEGEENENTKDIKKE